MADRTNPFVSKTAGTADKQSRAKAEAASKRANDEIQRTEVQDVAWPTGVTGAPMIRAEMAAAELIPTGQYANVSVGPARIHFFIDPDRDLPDDESYFSAQQRATIAKALNEAAEIVEADVVAVQRNIVLESMQDQVSS